MARTPKQVLLDEAIARLGSLEADWLRAANEFLGYLQELGEDEETTQILKIPGILDDIKEALADLEKETEIEIEHLRLR